MQGKWTIRRIMAWTFLVAVACVPLRQVVKAEGFWETAVKVPQLLAFLLGFYDEFDQALPHGDIGVMLGLLAGLAVTLLILYVLGSGVHYVFCWIRGPKD